MKKTIQFILNGEQRSIDVSPSDILLDVLRDDIGIKSPKYGCGTGDCGACTVLINGKSVRSCLVLAIEVDEQEIITLEGLDRNILEKLEKSFIKYSSFQCGFCAPGMIISAKALIDENPAPYNLGAHFLWLGYRTAFPDSAHVEYLRGIRNPIGIKVGPKTKENDLLNIIQLLNPDREPGRITLITRFGEQHVATYLPRIIQSVTESGHPVLWSCDPMHGNTEIAKEGRKTRRIDSIFSELEQTFNCHSRMRSCLGGVHFELTGEPVTECVGGAGGVTESDLAHHYETACDPRLNGAQALEMAFLISRLLR